jgi:hypothetical protein
MADVTCGVCVVDCGDWVVVYRDGEKMWEGHPDYIDILRAAGVSVTRVFPGDEDMQETAETGVTPDSPTGFTLAEADISEYQAFG